MGPKRSAKEVKVVVAPPAKKAKPAAKSPAKPAAKAAPAKAAAKAPSKAVKSAAKPAAKLEAAAKSSSAKRGAKKETDPTAFVEALLEVCKVLMTICQSNVVEDEETMTVTTTEDFKTYGGGILALLPEDARLPMMKLALMYAEELDHDPFLWAGDDDDDEVGAPNPCSWRA